MYSVFSIFSVFSQSVSPLLHTQIKEEDSLQISVDGHWKLKLNIFSYIVTIGSPSMVQITLAKFQSSRGMTGSMGSLISLLIVTQCHSTWFYKSAYIFLHMTYVPIWK